MRKLLKYLIIGVIVALSVASCGGLLEDVVSDPADAFVGNYSMSQTYLSVIANTSNSYTADDGGFILTKLSKDKVKMTGGWTTIGTVIGNTVSFEDTMQSGDMYSQSYSFSVATLTGNTLKFSYSSTGHIKFEEGGLTYPWSCTGNVTATKLNN